MKLFAVALFLMSLASIFASADTTIPTDVSVRFNCDRGGSSSEEIFSITIGGIDFSPGELEALGYPVERSGRAVLVGSILLGAPILNSIDVACIDDHDFSAEVPLVKGLIPYTIEVHRVFTSATCYEENKNYYGVANWGRKQNVVVTMRQTNPYSNTVIDVNASQNQVATFRSQALCQAAQN